MTFKPGDRVQLRKGWQATLVMKYPWKPYTLLPGAKGRVLKLGQGGDAQMLWDGRHGYVNWIKPEALKLQSDDSEETEGLRVGPLKNANAGTLYKKKLHPGEYDPAWATARSTELLADAIKGDRRALADVREFISLKMAEHTDADKQVQAALQALVRFVSTDCLSVGLERGGGWRKLAEEVHKHRWILGAHGGSQAEHERFVQIDYYKLLRLIAFDLLPPEIQQAATSG